MATPRFTRTIENFECAHCHAAVAGDGYTNHCPACLWSRHVDNFPGDRGNPCRGMMAPTRVGQRHGDWYVLHRCERCGTEKWNRSVGSDNFEALLRVARGAPLAAK